MLKVTVGRLNTQGLKTKAVQDNAQKTAIKVLRKAAAYLRLTASRSIRKRKRISKPGQPPSSHKGTLKKNILYAWDPKTTSYVIGPVRLAGSKAPMLLEFGGRTTFIKIRKKRKTRVPAHYRPRPFMLPAWEKTAPKLDDFWRNALTQ